MTSPVDRSPGHRRDVKLLEDLRKLRRDRAESAMRAARAAVAAAERLVVAERDLVDAKHDALVIAQQAVSSALATGRQSLDDVLKLLRLVDRKRTDVHESQSLMSALLRSQRQAEAKADEAMILTREAAAAHEKVLEWKKSA